MSAWLTMFAPLAALLLFAGRLLRSRADAACLAFTLWCALALASAEVLGAFHQWTEIPVAVFWGLVTVAALSGYAALRGRPPGAGTPETGVQAAEGAAAPAWLWWSLCLVVIAVPALDWARAALTTPNSPDALNYHLPRQLYWLQSGTLDFAPGLPARLQAMPPLAEILQAQSLLVGRTDALAAFPQALALPVFMLAAALLCAELGGGRVACLLSALLAGTVPVAYHQGSGCKNDLLVAALVGLVFLHAVRLWKRPASGAEWMRLGLCAGLAVATKPNALLWLALPSVMLAIPALRFRGLAAAGLVIALTFPLPHYLRTAAAYGNPFDAIPAAEGGALASTRHTPAALVSTGARNVALLVATPSERVNGALQAGVGKGLELIGEDPSSPDTSMGGEAFSLSAATGSELSGGAPFHLALGLLCLGIWAARRRRRRQWPVCFSRRGAFFCTA